MSKDMTLRLGDFYVVNSGMSYIVKLIEIRDHFVTFEVCFNGLQRTVSKESFMADYDPAFTQEELG